MSLALAEAQPAGAGGAHPLLYASFTPFSPSRRVSCIDMYRPKTEYSLGRNPESDIVLPSQYFEWSYCTLQWNSRDEVHIVDLFSVNGVWVNRRRLTPGEPYLLRDGDTVFFAMCGLAKSNERDDGPPPPRYEVGNDFAYTYHQYTDCSPPLEPNQQKFWIRLDGLERACWRIEDEIEQLKRERDVMLQEKQSILKELPEPPPPERPRLADELEEVWAEWDNIRKQQHVSIKLPEDFRELFRPDTDDLPYYPRWRSKYQTLNRECPPPLPWGSILGGWTRCYHHTGWPDWNNPDIIWDGVMPLDQSRPLIIPPSIIYWSARYHLPVYAHPRFDPDSTRIYARPYASSTEGFSDYSAAAQRQRLKLPPLEDPPIIRPRAVLNSLDCQWCPDEDELADRVATLLPTLRPDDDLLPEPSPSRESSPGLLPFLAIEKEYSHLLGTPEQPKRKRDVDDEDGEDDNCASPASSPRHTSIAALHEASAPSTKRRRISASPPPHPHTEAPSAPLPRGADVPNDLTSTAAGSSSPEAGPSSLTDNTS